MSDIIKIYYFGASFIKELRGVGVIAPKTCRTGGRGGGWEVTETNFDVVPAQSFDSVMKKGILFAPAL